ncbi:recombinase family protein [Loktanella sp. DJP18]|uniref:recombinase family protein n=1 Tax=Loktanella sp. DJP18 TaxID=3409788 RepID=UPI003BB79A6C
MSLIGCAPVSTAEQDLALLLDALNTAGTSRIFEDQSISGAKTERPGLTAALSFLREGDTLGQEIRHRLERAMPQCDLPPTITSPRVLARQEQEELGPSPGVGSVNLTRKDIV